MSFQVKMTLKNAGHFANKLERINNRFNGAVKVGYPERGSAPHPMGHGLTIAQIAMFNEFGTMTKKGTTWIPPRPFFRNAYTLFIPKFKPLAERIRTEYIRAASNGNINTWSANLALMGLGEQFKQEIQMSIIEGGWAPNAPFTIRQKKSDRPLVWTGLLRQAVQVELDQGWRPFK